MLSPNELLKIERISAFQDNYIWLLHCNGRAAVVDPGDARPVREALSFLRLVPTAILTTHHHADHIGGIADLRTIFDIPVLGPKSERIPCQTHELADGDVVNIPGLNIEFSILSLPGHTLGSIAYYGAGCLFCGDTLFAGGCGRLFEGTPEQMFGSLNRIAQLPADTEVYCAHEYTESNLRFALAVEPANQALKTRLSETRRLRAQREATVPSILGDELATNPYLRCDELQVRQSAEVRLGRPAKSSAEVFATLRQWKDNFRA